MYGPSPVTSESSAQPCARAVNSLPALSTVASQPVLAGGDVLEVVGGRDHDEDDVAIGELRGGVDELGALLDQRLRLGPGAVETDTS
jgi:hypothetical protein